jgi:hypothetical protein
MKKAQQLAFQASSILHKEQVEIVLLGSTISP